MGRENFRGVSIKTETITKIERIQKVKPELRSHAQVIDAAVEKYYEWLITFTKEERLIFKSHIKK